MADKSVCKIEGCGKPAISGEAQRYFHEIVLGYEGDECLPWPFARHTWGYGLIWADGKTLCVHTLVCEQKCGPRPTPEHQAAHSCGKGHFGCVTKRHLSWKTRAENMADKLIHGTHNRGERQGRSKLTEAQVIEIRALRGVKKQREIAEQFAISLAHVCAVQTGRAWPWLS